MSRLSRILLWSVAAIAATVLLAFVFVPATGPAPPSAKDGALDLTAWTFDHAPAVPLAGEWRYHDKRWAADIKAEDLGVAAPMPGPWPVAEPGTQTPRHEGFGTYTLTLSLPPAPAGERFAIDTGYIYSAYRLYANGKLIVESGTPAATEAGEVPRAYSTLALLPEDERTVELRLETSNHLARTGGVFVAPAIAYESQLALHRSTLAGLSLLALGSMLFASTYHFIVHLLTRSRPTILWFGICASLIGLRTLMIEPLAGFTVQFVGQDWLWRINFAISIFALAAAYQFFTRSFPRQISHRFAAPISAACVIAGLLPLAFGPAFGEVVLKAYEILVVVTFAYITWGVIRAALAQEAGSHLALAGWIVTATVIFHDMMLDNGIIVGINLIPFGFMAFFLCLSGTLATQFNKSLRDVETLSKQLQRANIGLEDAVRDRTAQLSDRLRELEKNRAALEAARVEAVSASAAKTNFLATMSHEIRTPLNAVLGVAGLLADTSLNAEQRNQVELIRESGDHLLTLISEILDLSKLDAGHGDLELAAFDPAALTAGAVNLLLARAQEKGLALQFDTAKLPPAALGDAARIRQILINLVGNAIKFTSQGEVRVAVDAKPRGTGHDFVWTITDTGIGIAADRLPHLFEDFAQADSSISRRFGGTGLGLAISKRLCELMGGTIGVASEEGKGTAFTVAIHLAAADRSTVECSTPTIGKTEIEAHAAALGRSIRILVAEDNVTNQLVARGILKSPSINVDIANNGLEAIDAVKKYPYDVVLMDIQMPEADGLTATRRIRAMGSTFATLPIIALSANAFAQDIEASRQAGMNGHLPKPVRPDLLLAAVYKALTHQEGFQTIAEADAATDIIDRAAIDHLIETLTETVTKELISDFLNTMRTKIEHFPAKLENGEPLKIEVHSIKSAARQLGAVALSRLAAELEQKAGAQAISAADIDELRRQLAAYADGLAKLDLLAA